MKHWVSTTCVAIALAGQCAAGGARVAAAQRIGAVSEILHLQQEKWKHENKHSTRVFLWRDSRAPYLAGRRAMPVYPRDSLVLGRGALVRLKVVNDTFVLGADLPRIGDKLRSISEGASGRPLKPWTADAHFVIGRDSAIWLRAISGAAVVKSDTNLLVKLAHWILDVNSRIILFVEEGGESAILYVDSGSVEVSALDANDRGPTTRTTVTTGQLAVLRWRTPPAVVDVGDENVTALRAATTHAASDVWRRPPFLTSPLGIGLGTLIVGGGIVYALTRGDGTATGTVSVYIP